MDDECSAMHDFSSLTGKSVLTRNSVGQIRGTAGMGRALHSPAIGVEYDGVTVGSYVAGLLVEDSVLVEIKAVRGLDRNHDAQCLNYLRATGLTVCLLMNFANAGLEIRGRVNGF
jgi:hypothetical protein